MWERRRLWVGERFQGRCERWGLVQMPEGLLLIIKASIYIPLLCTFLCVLSMLQFWAWMGEGALDTDGEGC